MATLTVRNRGTTKATVLYLEPWGEDYWLLPGDEVSVETAEERKQDVFSVDMQDEGIQVWVQATQAVVVSASGVVLDSGHQRPV